MSLSQSSQSGLQCAFFELFPAIHYNLLVLKKKTRRVFIPIGARGIYAYDILRLCCYLRHEESFVEQLVWILPSSE
jgi:hypothetical protein